MRRDRRSSGRRARPPGQLVQLVGPRRTLHQPPASGGLLALDQTAAGGGRRFRDDQRIADPRRLAQRLLGLLASALALARARAARDEHAGKGDRASARRLRRLGREPAPQLSNRSRGALGP